MPGYYYLSRIPQQKGAAFVHVQGCESLPPKDKRLFLGTFYHERDAFKTAQVLIEKARPCPLCFEMIEG